MAASDQILTVGQMREAEQALIAGGESVESLMQRAGTGIAEWIWRMASGRPVTVLCGPGNNGGDGYVAARLLHERGCRVAVIAPREPATQAAQAARQAYRGPCSDRRYQAGAGGVLVDCLFGSGLSRPLDNDLAGLLAALAADHALRIAVDLPSGVESDRGIGLNAGLPDYHLTIALGAWKYAHWLMPAMAEMGERRLIDIGIGRVEGAARLVGKPDLSPPPRDSHKYTRGLLGIVGGAMPGAALLAARAAMHGGAGYVKLLCDERPGAVPDELVVDTADLAAALDDRRFDALLVGPGLGRGEAALARLKAVLARDLPSVIDGDGLTLLRPEMIAGRKSAILLTPHEGELQLLARRFAVEEPDRVHRADALARISGAVIVAKGPDTLIASPDGAMAIVPPAPSWLSTAGAGDVLAGLAASRLATGRNKPIAAAEAAWLHGEAARHCLPPFTAGELVAAVPGAYAACL